MSNKIQISQIQGLEGISLDITTINTNLATTGADLSGNLVTTGQSLQYKIDDISGNLITTGFDLENDIDSVSGLVVSTGDALFTLIDNLENDLIATGVFFDGQDSTISGDLSSSIESTGSFLKNRYDTQSGTFRSDITTLSGTIDTNIDDISGLETGFDQLRLDVDTNIGTISGLDNVVSGLSVTVNSYSTGFDAVNAATLTVEALYSDLSGLVVNTGSYFDSEINDVNAFISSTGFAIGNEIDTVSGNLVTTGSNLNYGIETVSGNLITTGTTLKSDVATITGNLSTTGATLQSNITTVGSNLSTTGSSIAVTLGQNPKFASQIGSLTFNTGSDDTIFRQFAILGGNESRRITLNWTYGGNDASWVDLPLGGNTQNYSGFLQSYSTFWVEAKALATNVAYPDRIYALQTGFILYRENSNAIKIIETEGQEFSNSSGVNYSIIPYIGEHYLGFSGNSQGDYVRYNIFASIDFTYNYF